MFVFQESAMKTGRRIPLNVVIKENELKEGKAQPDKPKLNAEFQSDFNNRFGIETGFYVTIKNLFRGGLSNRDIDRIRRLPQKLKDEMKKFYCNMREIGQSEGAAFFWTKTFLAGSNDPIFVKRKDGIPELAMAESVMKIYNFTAKDMMALVGLSWRLGETNTFQRMNLNVKKYGDFGKQKPKEIAAYFKERMETYSSSEGEDGDKDNIMLWLIRSLNNSKDSESIAVVKDVANGVFEKNGVGDLMSRINEHPRP